MQIDENFRSDLSRFQSTPISVKYFDFRLRVATAHCSSRNVPLSRSNATGTAADSIDRLFPVIFKSIRRLSEDHACHCSEWPELLDYSAAIRLMKLIFLFI